jgi:hypothetical protein
MAKSKVSDYVSSAPAPAPQENHGAAIANKAHQVIGKQVAGAVADIQVVEGIRDGALNGLSDRIASLVSPDRFTSDLYDLVAQKLSGQTLAYRPVFGEVAIDVESIRLPTPQRVSVSDFLALPAGEPQNLSGYEPLSIEGSDDADY